MSQSNRDLTGFGPTLSGSNRPVFVLRFWHSLDRAIESNGLTMIEGSPPIMGKSFNAHSYASPPLGDGVSERKGFSMEINYMQR